MQSVSLLGVRLDVVSQEEVLQKCREFLMRENHHLITTVNAEFIVLAQADTFFRNIINSSALCLTDAMGVVVMAKFFLKKKLVRLPGADFFWPLLELAAEQGSKVYFLGGALHSAAKTVEVVKKKYPSLKIAGFNQGPRFQVQNQKIIFDQDQEELNNQVVKEINQTQAEIIFVAFGAPKQEYWINNFLSQCPSVKIAIGVGGTFDFVAGIAKRAPLFMRRLGLEWFWRLLVQPWRYKRIFNALINFPLLCFNYYIIKKRYE